MLTQPIQELAERVSALSHEAHEGHDTPLEVNDVVSAVAGGYEKLRYLLEYRDEHTVRRAAIERMLRRRLILEGQAFDGGRLARELVEGKYLSVDAATEEFAQASAEIVSRFESLASRSGDEYRRRLLSFAASEIDALLSVREAALDASVIDAMYKTLRPHVSAYGYTAQDIDTQLFCACRRAVLNADDESLGYALWLAYVPDWKNGGDEHLAQAVPGILAAIRRDVKHGLQWLMVPRIKRESISFRIVRSYVGESRHPDLSDDHALDAYARNFLSHVYETERERIKSSGIRAVAYLFLTKFVVALAVEAPYEYFVLGAINYVPLVTNLLFHPALLFALTRNVGQLTEKNTEAVVEELHELLYEGHVRDIKVRSGYGRFSLLFALFYFLLILGIFGGIIGVLQAIGFNVIGGALFVFFLSLVTFFAFRIRMRASRWVVIEQKGVVALVTNALVAPIVRVGRYLSRTFSSINVFVLFMDFILETPFKMLLNFSHHFLIYLREKANEVY